MTAWTCAELRSAAAEVALDDLTGAERASALGHLGGCADCRAVVADLAAVADSLLLVAPTIEPPVGFESRVLERFRPMVPGRRRWPAAVAAVVIALVAGAAGFGLAQLDRDERRLPVAAVLRGGDGSIAGSMVLAEDPDRMTCVFEDERFGGAYEVEIVLDDGSVTPIGAFHADGVPWSWTVELPVAAADVRAVRVLDGGGVLRVSAEVD